MTKLDKIIAQLTLSVTHDGDGTNRLFLETLFTRSLTYSQTQYEAMEADLASFCIKGEGFEVYAWNDVSGYEYWTVQQEEDNYIQISVQIKRGKVDVNALNKALLQADEHFSKYAKEA